MTSGVYERTEKHSRAASKRNILLWQKQSYRDKMKESKTVPKIKIKCKYCNKMKIFSIYHVKRNCLKRKVMIVLLFGNMT
jgi:hypothetical protein